MNNFSEHIEREVERVINYGGLGNVAMALGVTIRDENDYARIMKKSLESHLNGANISVSSPGETAHATSYLSQYLPRLVEVLSEKMGHPEYIQLGKKIADQVLANFTPRSRFKSYEGKFD